MASVPVLFCERIISRGTWSKLRTCVCVCVGVRRIWLYYFFSLVRFLPFRSLEHTLAAFISIQNGNDNTFDGVGLGSMNTQHCVRAPTRNSNSGERNEHTQSEGAREKMQNVNQDIPIFSNVYLHSRHFLASQLFAQRNAKQTHDERDERLLQHRTRYGRTPLFHRRASRTMQKSSELFFFLFFFSKKRRKTEAPTTRKNSNGIVKRIFLVFVRSLSLTRTRTHTLFSFLFLIHSMEEFCANHNQ